MCRKMTLPLIWKPLFKESQRKKFELEKVRILCPSEKEKGSEVKVECSNLSRHGFCQLYPKMWSS